MMARNKSGIEKFFTKYTKEIMAGNYTCKNDAQELTEGSDSGPQYNFQTNRCLGEYVGYTTTSIQL